LTILYCSGKNQKFVLFFSFEIFPGLEHCRTQMEKKGLINHPPISESPDEVDNHAFDDPLVDHDPEQS
jgi:hypothetical protein